MRIDLRNLQRKRLFQVTVDTATPPPIVKAPEGHGQDVYLEWSSAFDDHGHLRRCPVCGCRELFVRKDFPQVTGFILVVLAALLSMVLFGIRQVFAAVVVLMVLVLVDAVIYFFAGRCLVCYRCRSEFRQLPIREDHPGWDLAVGEKYRQVGNWKAAADTQREEE
ncbi:MAG: hypothetical protein WD042_16220 [Phycisphaeraceae bacterium]